MATGDVLVVMAKQPVAGSVKTRLARALGAEAACALYAAFLRDMAARLACPSWRLAWAVEPAAADLSPWVGPAAETLGQRGAELGERMRHAFADLFAAGARRVAMIGADVPHLDPGVVADALAGLDQDDVVLLPTRDGGYCLLALRAPYDLFSGVPMGGPAVLDATRARLAALGLHGRELPPTFDVDEIEDLRALARLVSTGAVSLPHTKAALATLALG